MNPLPSYLDYELENYDRLTPLQKVALCEKVKYYMTQQVDQIQNSCDHLIVESSFYSNGTVKGLLVVSGGIAPCPKCHKRFSGQWYCPKSKTHFCEYDKYDTCLHCHQPSERK